MNIAEKLAAAVGAVEALDGRVYPSGLVADDVPSPLAVYRFTGSEAVQTLDGAVAYRVDTAQIDIWGESYDQLWDIALEVESALAGLADVDLGGGHWLCGVAIGGKAPDAVDVVRGELCRSVVAAFSWV